MVDTGEDAGQSKYQDFQEAIALDLLTGGENYKTIANVIGCTREEAKVLVNKQLAARVAEIEADPNYIKRSEVQTLDQLDVLWTAFHPLALQGNKDAVEACLKIADRRRALKEKLRAVGGVGGQGELEATDARGALRSAWTVLARGGTRVAEVLVDIAVNGNSESARVAASQAVLDRIGLVRVDKSEVQVSVLGAEEKEVVGLSAAEIIKSRLAELGMATPVDVDAVDYDISVDTEAVILEGEIIED